MLEKKLLLRVISGLILSTSVSHSSDTKERRNALADLNGDSRKLMIQEKPILNLNEKKIPSSVEINTIKRKSFLEERKRKNEEKTKENNYFLTSLQETIKNGSQPNTPRTSLPPTPRSSVILKEEKILTEKENIQKELTKNEASLGKIESIPTNENDKITSKEKDVFNQPNNNLITLEKLSTFLDDSSKTTEEGGNISVKDVFAIEICTKVKEVMEFQNRLAKNITLPEIATLAKKFVMERWNKVTKKDSKLPVKKL